MKDWLSELTQHYPEAAQSALQKLRGLILDECASQGLPAPEESLKWQELTFTSSVGSPFRVDWKAKNPDKIFVFFHCQASLVETFRELFPKEFYYEGKRALGLPINGDWPEMPLRQCISLALTYKQVKHLPMLGV